MNLAVGKGALPALLLLAACTPPEAPRTGAAPPAPRLALEQAAARLPTEAAGFRRGQTLPLRASAQGREAGMEVAYATPAARHRAAALVRLNAAGAELPDGPGSTAASAAFNTELGDALRGDRARRLQESRRFTLEAAGRPTLSCAALEGSYGRQPVEALVCGGGLGGNVLRLRVSMPSRQPPLADAEAFAQAIIAALSAP
jgi:hypothetical protein